MALFNIQNLEKQIGKGVSPVFLILLLVGYAMGITMKILRGDFVYVGFFYVFNFILVSVNFISYLHFKRLEGKDGKQE